MPGGGARVRGALPQKKKEKEHERACLEETLEVELPLLFLLLAASLDALTKGLKLRCLLRLELFNDVRQPHLVLVPHLLQLKRLESMYFS